MSIIQSRKFLLCTQEGLWLIHRDNNCMILFQRYNDDGTTDPPLRIPEYVIADFSVDIDDRGTPHIFFFTMKGELFYGHMKKDNWNIQPLSTFDPSRYTIFCPNLIIKSNYIHLVFIIKDYQNNTYNILHHYWNNTQWKINKVAELSRMVKTQVKLNVKMDGNDNLHLIYNTGNTQGSYRLYYIKYNHSLNLWGSPIEVTNKLNNHFDWDVAIDKDNNANIVWIAKSDDHNLCLCTLYSSMNIQTFISIVESRFAPCSHISLLHINNRLNLLWHEDGKLWVKESEDMGKTWHELYCLSLGDKDIHHLILVNPALIDPLNTCYDKSLQAFGILKNRLHIYRLCDFVPLFNDVSQQKCDDYTISADETNADEPIRGIDASLEDNSRDKNHGQRTGTWKEGEGLIDTDNCTTQELFQYMDQKMGTLNDKQSMLSEQLLKISDEIQKVDVKLKTWQHVIDRLQGEISILNEKTLLKRICKLLKMQ